jgi:DNA-binding transcriptional LysR family regulator
VLRTLALLGHGIALLDDYTVQAHMDIGRLRRVLPHIPVTNSSFEWGQGIYAVFRQAEFVPAKLRVFLDFLSAPRIRALARDSSLPSLPLG